MSPGAIVLLSLGMSTDAFAAAVGRGASHRPDPVSAVKAGAVFGLVEAATPLIGWSLGTLAAGFVESVDHWIAFALLAVVGGHMIFHAVGPADEPHDADAADGRPRRSGPLALVATAIGTSIDAAAVGVGLAFIGVNIWVIAASIGVTTFAMTTTGMLIGRAVGARFGKWAELAGGLVLIGIGVAILVEHLGG